MAPSCPGPKGRLEWIQRTSRPSPRSPARRSAVSRPWTSWLTQRVQFRGQQGEHDLTRRQELYKSFIDEASKLYADAFEHDDADTSKLVHLYAMISLMRIMSSPPVVASADGVARTIIETYLGPNRTFRDVRGILGDDTLNPLRDYSDACREELRQESSPGASKR